MQKFLVCGALLAALLFQNVENLSACTRPNGVIGIDKLEQQNAIINEFRIPRMEYVQTIQTLAEEGKLVQLPNEGIGFYLDGVGENKDGCENYPYPDDLRYVHPAAWDMTMYLGNWFDANYPGERLKITGGIRTPAWQALLAKCNGNAALGTVPSKRSAHLSGLAIDTSKKPLTDEQICALWDKCLEMQERGWVLCVDEIQENNLHIFVHPEFTILETLEPYPDVPITEIEILYGP